MGNSGFFGSTFCGLIAAAATVSCTTPTTIAGPAASATRQVAAATGVLPKAGNGANGFAFTQVSNSGALLPTVASLPGAGSNDWACTYDKAARLMWEIKTTSGPRAMSHTYSSYDSNAATNGGGIGAAGGGSCATAGRCDTEKFVQDVNTAGLCGHSDWRMPFVYELNELARVGMSATNDGGYFPNTVSGYYWSSSPVAGISTHAWTVSFVGGSAISTIPFIRDGNYYVRLVRDEQ